MRDMHIYNTIQPDRLTGSYTHISIIISKLFFITRYSTVGAVVAANFFVFRFVICTAWFFHTLKWFTSFSLCKCSYVYRWYVLVLVHCCLVWNFSLNNCRTTTLINIYRAAVPFKCNFERLLHYNRSKVACLTRFSICFTLYVRDCYLFILRKCYCWILHLLLSFCISQHTHSQPAWHCHWIYAIDNLYSIKYRLNVHANCFTFAPQTTLKSIFAYNVCECVRDRNAKTRSSDYKMVFVIEILVHIFLTQFASIAKRSHSILKKEYLSTIR